ncbi:MAG: hypothetical protein AAF414_11435 [Pseudomonadota bacterium]
MNTDPVGLARSILELSKAGRFADAVGPCDALIAASQPGERVRLVAVVPLSAEGRFDQAVAICDEIAQAEPGASQPLRLKVQVAIQHSNSDVLAEALAALLATSKSIPELNWLADRVAEAQWSDLPSAELRARLLGSSTAQISLTYVLLLVMLGRFEEARPYLIEASERSPNSPDVLAASAIAHAAAGDQGKAQELTGKVLNLRPFVASQKRESEASLLIVVDLLRGYFAPGRRRLGSNLYNSGNFPSEIREGRLSVNRLQFQTGALDRAIAEMPPIDVVLGNLSWAGAAPPPEIVRRYDHMVSELGAVALNHPSSHLEMSREANYQRWADAPEFIFPRTRVFDAGGDTDTIVSEIEADFVYPVILRPATTQVGGGMVLLNSPDELAQHLETTRIRQNSFYVIQYYETNSEGGYYRKYRSAVIDGTLIPFRLDTRPHWMVHRQKNAPDYVVPKEAIDEEVAMHQDFRSTLPDATLAALDRIAREAPLDIFGIDFGHTVNGRMIVYEANAMMNLIPYRFARTQPHFTPMAERIQTAIEDAVVRRKR